MIRVRGAALAAVAVAGLVGLGGCLPAGTRGTGGRPSGSSAAPAGTPATATASTSAPAASPSFVAPTPTPAPSFATYTVKSGDSLNSIAKAYATTARSVAFWNRAMYPSLDPDSPGRLKVGWTLQLIPGLVYDEETGDPVLPSGAIPAP